MRTSTLVLSFTTAVFAASTAYLAWQLQTQRENPGTGTALASDPYSFAEGSDVDRAPSAHSDVASHRETPPAAGAPLAAAGSLPAASASGESKDVAADINAVFMHQQLARLSDPVQRAALLIDARAGMRRQYGPLRDQLKLSDSTFEQLISIVAEQSLQGQEIYLRCATTPGCNSQENFKQHPVDDRSQELLALLGTDKVDELAKYQASIGERDAVAQLRGRLTEANAIRDEQAETLALALSDERQRFERETTARGSQTQGWGTNLGMILYSADSNSIDQRLIEAAQYSQRLRQRAAAVLTPAQLAAYNQMQDELLAQMATMLKPGSTAHRQRV